MHARQRKTSLRVIELSVRPLDGVMTGRAVGGESLVGRTGRIGEIFLMARNASGARQIKVVVGMAVGARPGRNRVPPRQRESHRIMVELRIQPVVRSVALFAGS